MPVCICAHAYIYVCTCVHVYACRHAYLCVYLCAHVCMHIYSCVYMYLSMYVFMCVYMHVCICVCACTFVCIYVHMCLCVYMPVYVSVCACARMRVYSCMCVYLSVHVCLACLHVFACVSLRVHVCTCVCMHVCVCMCVFMCVLYACVFMCVHACLCVHVCVSVLYACACLHVCAAITVLTSGPGTPTSLQAENPGESDLDVPGSVWQMWVERWVLEQKALPRWAGRWVPPAQEPRGWGIMVLLRVKVQSRGGTDPTLFPPHEADNESCYRTGGKAQTAEGPRRPRSRWAAGTRSRPAPSLPAATAHAEGGLLHRTAGRLPANTKAPRRPNLLNTSSSPEASTTKGWSQTLGMRAWPRG